MPFHPPKRILVIPLRYIGDTILTAPLVRNLRRRFPQAEIDLLAGRASATLMEPCPYLDRVLTEPKSTFERLKQLRAGRYDTVLILRKSASTALLCRLAGIRQVIGYDKQRFPWGYRRWGWFLDAAARYPSLCTDIPQAESHLQLLESLTSNALPVQDGHLELWTTDEDERRVSELLAAHGIDPARPMAVLHATSASHGKQIAIEKFADSVRHLLTAGYQVLATGTGEDAPVYDALNALMARNSAKEPNHLPESSPAVINLAGKTSLRETFALYKRIQVLLTVDSSPVHLGSAANVPTIVGVFGPTNERQWGAHNPGIDFRPVFMDLPCRPCYAKVCAHNNCKELLTAEQIQSVLGLEQPATLESRD